MLALGALASLLPETAHAAPPIVAFASPTEIDEGQSVMIEVTVTDPEGGTVDWSWDTDFDMVFDEHPGAMSYTVPATDTDGPELMRIGVRATDGDAETTTTYRSITVNNVAPELVSEPPLMASVRREYRYELSIDEPAGDNDPLELILTSKPDGMDLTEGVITWTPTPEQRGRDFPVVLRISDGDGGEDSQSWDIRVSRNTAPTSPVPSSPVMREMVAGDEPVTLVVENAADPDGDPLLYFFRMSRTSSFDSPEVIGSGEVEEGSDGTTSWTTSEPLGAGIWYWQVWAYDNIAETEPVYAQVTVGDPSMVPASDGGSSPTTDGGLIPGVDAGPGEEPGGGCSVTAPGSSPARLGWLALAAAAVWLSRRRSSLFRASNHR